MYLTCITNTYLCWYMNKKWNSFKFLLKKSAHFWTLVRDPVWGPFGEGSQRRSFFTTLTNFMIHSYMYFNQIIHFASHSLHWTNISLFTIFCSFWTLARDPCLGPFGEGSQRRSFFHYFNKFHDTFIHLLQSDHSLCFLLIALNKDLILSQFFAYFEPPARDPCLGPPLGGVSE